MTDEIISGRVFRKPEMKHISREDAPKLYDAEEELHEALHRAARELSTLMGFGREQRYTHAIPQTLCDLLESIDTDSAVLAARAFLELKNYEIREKGGVTTNETAQSALAL